MDNEYSVSIERAGVVDLVELCRCLTPEIAAEVVRVMLDADDSRIMSVKVDVVRIK